MDEKLITIWNTIRKQNDEIIQTRDSILDTCFIIKKDGSMQICALLFNTSKEKIAMKNFLKSFILNQSILGYMIIIDAKMIMMNMETKEKEVHDCVIRQLFTSHEKIGEAVMYKDKQIVKVIDMKDKFQTDWNIWDSMDDIPKNVIDDYNQYKKDNPEKFKDVL